MQSRIIRMNSVNYGIYMRRASCQTVHFRKSVSENGHRNFILYQ